MEEKTIKKSSLLERSSARALNEVQAHASLCDGDIFDVHTLAWAKRAISAALLLPARAVLSAKHLTKRVSVCVRA